MLEGKRFFPETGIPILKMARRMVLLAVELPEPFFVPTMIEKSLITLSMRLLSVLFRPERRECSSSAVEGQPKDNHEIAMHASIAQRSARIRYAL